MHTVADRLYALFMSGALVGYLVVALIYIAEIGFRRNSLIVLRQALLGVVVLLHFMAMLLFSTTTGGPLFTGIDGAALLFAWILALGLLLFEKRLSLGALGAFVVFVIFMVTLYAYGCPRAASNRFPGLESLWLKSHVPILLLGFVCFTLSACAAIMYLLKEHSLKHKRFTAMSRRLPSLRTSDAIVYYLSAAGLSLLTIGIMSGMIGQHSLEAAYNPLHDGKVIFSLILWCLYLGYFLSRRLLGWRGRRGNLVNVFNFFIMLLTFFTQHGLPESLQNKM